MLKEHCRLGSSGCPISSPIIFNIPPGQSNTERGRAETEAETAEGARSTALMQKKP